MNSSPAPMGITSTTMHEGAGRGKDGVPGRPRVLGHRGASADLTENTLEAFEEARRQGADGVELDVRVCATGEVVVFHDDDMKRLTGRPGSIESTPLEQLRRLELRGKTPGGIPTLGEVLAALPPPFLLNVELKSALEGWRERQPGQRARLVRGIAEVLDVPEVRARCVVSSFDPLALCLVRAVAPRLAIGLLRDRGQNVGRGAALWATVVRPATVHLHRADALAPGGLERWRRRGLPVVVWTVDAPAEARALAKEGVAALITNRPGAILEALE